MPCHALHARITRTRPAQSARQRQMRELLLERVGFYPDVAPSSVPDAGQGVFVRGCAPPGSVVCIYPGTVYMPEMLRTGEEVEALFYRGRFAALDVAGGGGGGGGGGGSGGGDGDGTSGASRASKGPLNTTVMGRFDRTIIDGSAALDGTGQWHESELGVPNAFARGHRVNHPPKGVRPNVMAFAYDLPADLDEWPGEESDASDRLLKQRGGQKFPHQLAKWLPNTFARPPSLITTDPTLFQQSIVFVATEELGEGDELFLNYRLNPKLEKPPWYTSVDPEEDERRWSTS